MLSSIIGGHGRLVEIIEPALLAGYVGGASTDTGLNIWGGASVAIVSKNLRDFVKFTVVH